MKKIILHIILGLIMINIAFAFTDREWINLSDTDADNWVGTSAVHSISYDSNNNLVWTGLADDKFGYYNI